MSVELPESQPAAAANASPLVSAATNGAAWSLMKAPLCHMARWNRPLPAGDIIFAAVLVEPADWPPSVTLWDRRRMRQCCRAPSVTRLADPADRSCRTDALRHPTQDGRDNPEGRGGN